MKSERDARPTALDSADPVRNFKLTVDERIRAITIGAPSWSLRKRKIEDDEERLVNELVELHDELVARGCPADQIEGTVVAEACKIDLTKLNDLVAKHNRYYPMEANLPMDSNGNYLVYGNAWRPEAAFTAERLVAKARLTIEQRQATGDGG